MADMMPKVDDAKAFAVLLFGAAIGGLIFAVLDHYGLLSQVRGTLGDLARRARAA